MWSAAVAGVARNLTLDNSVGVDVTFVLSNSVTREVVIKTVTVMRPSLISPTGARLVQDLTDADAVTGMYATATALAPVNIME